LAGSYNFPYIKYLNIKKTSDGFSVAGKNTLFQSSLHRDTKNMLLCKAILNCLFKCFLYDTEGFVNKQRFDMLMQPLVDQVTVKLYPASFISHLLA